MSYSHRIADLQLAERLEAFGAVLIEGPKWCGKTTTAEQMSKSVIKMQDTEMQEEYAATAASRPSLLLMGDTPRLIRSCALGCRAYYGGQASGSRTIHSYRIYCCRQK